MSRVRWWSLPHERRLARAMQQPFPPAWSRLLADRWPAWNRLAPADRGLLRSLVLGFLDQVEVEAANGFRVTPSMRVLVAAQASRLLLGAARQDGPARALRLYGDVRSVVVHPSTVVLDHERPTSMRHVMTREPMHLLGQAELHGPVLLAWDAVERGLGDGPDNVVLHEFAHKLDMLGGVVDGTPLLGTRDDRRAWHDAATATFRQLRRQLRRQRDPVLRRYGATNPAEFFAVATEAFFERPGELVAHHPRLYAAMVGLYQQHPAGALALPHAA